MHQQIKRIHMCIEHAYALLVVTHVGANPLNGGETAYAPIGGDVAARSARDPRTTRVLPTRATKSPHAKRHPARNIRVQKTPPRFFGGGEKRAPTFLGFARDWLSACGAGWAKL